MIHHYSPGNAMILSAETDSIIHTDIQDHEYILNVCDDYVEFQDVDGKNIIDYWGTCEDGKSTWRIMVHL